MKIQTPPQGPIQTPAAQAKPPVAPQPPQAPKDHFESSGDKDPQPPQKSGVRWGNIALAAGTVAGGAALGTFAGLHGGIGAELFSMACVPGLALAGGLIGGVAFEKFGPSSSEYRAIGGLMVGALVGAGAGVAQAFLAGGAGSPVLATTMGISGGFLGLAGLFKLATSSHHE